MILLEDLVEANSDLMMADLDGEAVLLNVHTGQYFGLNEVGTSIWSHIQEPVTVSTLIELLMAEYSVADGMLNRDVMSFLEALEKRNLIKVLTPANS